MPCEPRKVKWIASHKQKRIFKYIPWESVRTESRSRLHKLVGLWIRTPGLIVYQGRRDTWDTLESWITTHRLPNVNSILLDRLPEQVPGSVWRCLHTHLHGRVKSVSVNLRIHQDATRKGTEYTDIVSKAKSLGLELFHLQQYVPSVRRLEVGCVLFHCIIYDDIIILIIYVMIVRRYDTDMTGKLTNTMHWKLRTNYRWKLRTNYRWFTEP